MGNVQGDTESVSVFTRGFERGQPEPAASGRGGGGYFRIFGDFGNLGFSQIR